VQNPIIAISGFDDPSHEVGASRPVCARRADGAPGRGRGCRCRERWDCEARAGGEGEREGFAFAIAGGKVLNRGVGLRMDVIVFRVGL